jgi:hypothetical protein
MKAVRIRDELRASTRVALALQTQPKIDTRDLKDATRDVRHSSA